MNGTVLRSRWMLAAGAAVALFVVAVGVRWWLTPPPAPAPAPPAARPAPSPPQAEIPFLNIKGTQLSGADPEGRRQWDLRAKTLQLDRAKNLVVLTEVSGQLYQAGAPRLVFAAPQAVFFIATKDVELRGGVVARTPDGRTLRAAEMRWDGRRQLLIATGGVTVTQAKMTIHADRLTSDAGLAHPTFSGNITVKVNE